MTPINPAAHDFFLASGYRYKHEPILRHDACASEPPHDLYTDGEEVIIIGPKTFRDSHRSLVQHIESNIQRARQFKTYRKYLDRSLATYQFLKNSTGSDRPAVEGSLTAEQASNLTAPGRYADGHGLILNVNDNGNKHWLFRYQRDGRERWMGLGPLHTVDIERAREDAKKARLLLRDGIDPIDARKNEKSRQRLKLADQISIVTSPRRRSMEKRPCTACSEEFKPTHPDATTCSSSCAAIEKQQRLSNLSAAKELAILPAYETWTRSAPTKPIMVCETIRPAPALKVCSCGGLFNPHERRACSIKCERELKSPEQRKREQKLKHELLKRHALAFMKKNLPSVLPTKADIELLMQSRIRNKGSHAP